MPGERKDPRVPRARRLRREATREERLLWAQLRAIELPSGHFRRQVPIGPYFADFAHHGLRLVVEVDGDQHGRDDGLSYDAKRTEHLEAHGYRVLRFTNAHVRGNVGAIVEAILDSVKERVGEGPSP